MRFAICYFSQAEQKEIRAYLKQYLSYHDLTSSTIETFSSDTQLLGAYKDDQSFDIVFIDIGSFVTSRLQVALKLRLQGSKAMIILKADSSKHMADAFKVEAFDFLIPPVSCADFSGLLTRCVDKYRLLHNEIYLKTASGGEVIRLEEIVCISSELHYVVFFSVDQRAIKTKATLNQIEKKLNNYLFVRSHQSYLVNLSYIAQIDKQSVITKPLSNGNPVALPISKKYRDSLLERFLAQNTLSDGVFR